MRRSRKEIERSSVLFKTVQEQMMREKKIGNSIIVGTDRKKMTPALS